jgi:hypothetical protein
VKLGQIIDKVFGNSVAQIFGVGITAVVDKGQHSERINAFSGVDINFVAGSMGTALFRVKPLLFGRIPGDSK